MKRKGFTLIEMLVVIGIIAVLMGVTLGSVSKFLKSADKARCQELVSNTATALTVLFQREGVWPKALREGHKGSHMLDEDAALPLAKGGYMSLTLERDENGRVKKPEKIVGYDRHGIVSPWAYTIIKKRGNSVDLSTKVPGIGKMNFQDHILRYAIDLDGDGVIPGVNIGGESIDIRATAAVWFEAKDNNGISVPYSRGTRGGGVYSWTVGQTREVQK